MASLLADLAGKREPSREVQKPSGIFVGDGLPPVPSKLAEKIRRGEFVEMHELLPEFWAVQRMEGLTQKTLKVTKRVRDILVWLQCFALCECSGQWVARINPRAHGLPGCNSPGQQGV